VSALFILVTREKIKKVVVAVCLTIVLLTLFCGSVFTKLQVDYLLSVFFFAVMWIWFSEKKQTATLIILFFPICFILLIKQIGLVLGAVILCILLFDILFCDECQTRDRLKSITVLLLTGIAMLVIKQVWTNHCELMGFAGFSSAINPDSIKASLRILSNEEIQKGFWIFMKGIFIGPADRLNLPYLLWYLGLGFLWYKLLKDDQLQPKKRYVIASAALVSSFLLYLLMMYFLQIIVFKVGVDFDHTVGLTRYMNTFFAQMVFFTVILFYHHRFFVATTGPDKAVYAFVILVILVLGISRVEESMNREKGDLRAQQIAQQISNHIDIQKGDRIGLIPGQNDDHLGIKFLYHLFPAKVNFSPFPVDNQEAFLKEIVRFDYVVFKSPGQQVVEWSRQLFDKPVDKPFEKAGLYMVSKSKDDQKPKLKKIF